jgi:hypothetical protein
MPADRPVRPCPDIGGGARNRAGDTDAAEQGRADIGRALRHQFAIGAVAPPGHAVGHNGGEQRFDGAEQGEGDRGGQHVHDLGHGEIAGTCGMGRPAGMARRSV